MTRIQRARRYLYGKTQPRPGRKMGRLTALAYNPRQALDGVLSARRRLAGSGAKPPRLDRVL